MKKQTSFTRDELLRCGRGEMFGPGNLRLPMPPMLMLDRVVHVAGDGGRYGQGTIVAEQDIRPDCWFFEGHFLDDPVMPGCLGVDALWQLLGFFLAWQGHPGRGRALGLGQVRFKEPILPAARLVTYHLDVKRVVARRLVVGLADGTVSVDGRPTYTAQDLQVGLFVPAKPG